MSLLDQLKCTRDKLKPTTTRVLHEDGQESIEERNSNGEFVSEEGDHKEISAVSNRRKKKVERARRLGFVVDLQPDLQLALICPGVYLGSQDVAADLSTLDAEKITHIVNCATGVPNYFPKRFKYLQLEVLDLPSTDIVPSCQIVHDFIKDCVGNGGKVLVHCNAGVSRAPTFVISYLMLQYNLSLHDAIATVRNVRPKVRPNDGFLKQLEDLDRMNKAHISDVH
ncbi:unnamed protein product [Cylicocyclus nassatus]|uniref:Dual specificity protein phosphatase 19 n=1 Tax=Cylicocyclus nassatus TaxID=53992 RepID=A0AA36GRH7_CYLNA|nr:unnamed protein product [Cylicocyclus nassatus]